MGIRAKRGEQLDHVAMNTYRIAADACTLFSRTSKYICPSSNTHDCLSIFHTTFMCVNAECLVREGILCLHLSVLKQLALH
jgi:hypothetical protein